MPRSRRSDSAPLISVDAELVQFRDGLKESYRGNRFAVSAFRKGREDGYYIVNDRLNERLSEIRRNRKARGILALDEGMLHMMMAHFRNAKATPELDKAGKPIIENERYLFRLRVVGCRVYMNYEQIAAAYNTSVSTVERHVAIMIEEELIVNKCCGYGKGKQSSWYEFDAMLGWRGDSTWRDAYILVQSSQSPLTIVVNNQEHLWGNLNDDEDYIP